MKKIQLMITVLTLSLLFSACANESKQETATNSETTAVTTESTTAKQTTASTTPATTESTTASTSTSEQSSGESLSSMSLDAIANKLTADIADMPMTENMEITADLYPNYLFIDYIDGSEALANEGLMSSVAHSAVLLRLPEGSDVEKIRSEIADNADPNKWICVGAEKTEAVSNGNLILFVMSFEDITNTMVDRFKNMK